jgi:exosome complex RNA-binding protein Rrp4
MEWYHGSIRLTVAGIVGCVGIIYISNPQANLKEMLSFSVNSKEQKPKFNKQKIKKKKRYAL